MQDEIYYKLLASLGSRMI